MLLVTVLFLFWSGLVWSHVEGYGYGTVDDYSLYYSRLKIASGSLFLFAFQRDRARYFFSSFYRARESSITDCWELEH